MINFTPKAGEYLQAGIIKPHGRSHTRVLLIKFVKDEPKELLKTILEISGKVTSYTQQVEDSELRKEALEQRAEFKETAVVSFGLSSSGFRLLNKAMGYSGPNLKNIMPEDIAFRLGMKERKRLTADYHSWSDGKRSDASTTEDSYEKYISRDGKFIFDSFDAVVLVSHHVKGTLQRIVTNLPLDGKVIRSIHQEWGYLNRSKDSDKVIGPLGYREGLASEGSLRDRVDRSLVSERWDNGIVTSDNIHAYGSYFAFKKYETDICAFNDLVANLATRLDAEEPELLARALIMGRFPNGTPLSLSEKEIPETHFRSSKEEIPWNYNFDPSGLYCPHYSHIRAVNPRLGKTSSPILRRGYTYGDPLTNNYGLLFMSFQCSITQQFEPLLGQSGKPSMVKDLLLYRKAQFRANSENKKDIPKGYVKGGDELTIPSLRDNVIKFKGGEYFYFPSLHFFQQLSKL